MILRIRDTQWAFMKVVKKSSGSTNYRKFLDWLRNYQLLSDSALCNQSVSYNFLPHATATASTLSTFYQTPQRKLPEDNILYSHNSDNLKPHVA